MENAEINAGEEAGPVTAGADDPELEGLRQLQQQLVGMTASAWQPRCVARAFHTGLWENPFVFTMGTWIDLDFVESPFLQGRLPEAETALVAFEQAFAAFGHTETTPANCTPHQLVLLGNKMIQSIKEGFAMGVRMNPPKGNASDSGNNGFGDWLSIMACLKVQLQFSIEGAYALPVGRAFALIAAHRGNEGWTTASEPYALRSQPGS